MSERSGTVLDGILQSTREALERRREARPLAELRAEAVAARSMRSPGGARLRTALERPGIGVIAEFKRRSPSAGTIVEDAEVTELVSAYERGGASALSVLTEEANFEGSMDDLRVARAVSKLPILRKDFVIDHYQLYEALLAGADAVLLIVAALPRQQLDALHSEARELGLETLVEVHDLEELSSALAIQAEIIGINNRDLRDFSVDVERTSRLLGDVPSGVLVVSESGIGGPEQVALLEQQGVNAVLVGESLMRAPDPEHAVARLLAASRANA